MDHSHHDHMHHTMAANSTMMSPTASSHSHHASIDHGSMDHTGMDHEGMNHSGMHGNHMMMMMYFHFTLNDYVLFNFWKVNDVTSLISSMIGIFVAAMLYEGLKYFREYLYWKNYSMLQYQTVNKPVTQENERVINKPSLFTTHHVVQTFLHVIQIVVSYLLMLIFMTYNVWLCIAVTLGSATGYFLFGWKKSLFVDVTEHCH